jgi:hypothetical protein
MQLDPIFVYTNYAEAGLWVALSVVTIVKRNSRSSWGLAGFLLAFGVSDVIETRTGAWYEPIGLLALKAVCVVGIVTCGAMVWRARRQPPPT